MKRQRDPSPAKLGVDLANDFLRLSDGSYRTPDWSNDREGFTHEALASGAVLADFFIEQKERAAGLVLQTFVRQIERMGDWRWASFKYMYGRLVRALERITEREHAQAPRITTLDRAGHPPHIMNVLHRGFFTAMTRLGTLWRPASVLRKTTEGRLISYDSKSFYQTDNDVTQAIYKVPGYGYPVAIWFNNKTGQRIA